MQGPALLDRFSAKNDRNDAGATVRASSFETIEGEQGSDIIDTLLARPTLLKTGSPYHVVAEAALSASARASEAELRAARLRAEAKSKNWLPTLGASLSLSSLGDVVTSLLVEQVLLDNGRRKAERAFAAADVEVAAVSLSTDMNARVETALALYLTALRGDEKAALNGRALGQMREFDRIVRGRVEGGISDRADLRVVEAKVHDITSAQTSAEEAARTSRAELQAMTGRSFPADFAKLSLDTPPAGLRSLAVLNALAEANRSVSGAKIERAGLLPGISAQANVTGSGTTAAITSGTGTPIGFGTPAALKAVALAQDTADRYVAEAEEGARRDRARQEQRLASFRRQETEAARLAQESRETFRLFQRQFQAGQRSVMDVVSIYETMVQREQAHVDAKYEVILIQLEMAKDLGLLAEGGSI
ncbi:Type I secretion system, outer membrane component LapE [Candidatus Rhodobacter oscarellae]|uniref:Type I secretion system, outer membrane component LapE n=2 Tax=Candidatus Rhodobacter oscarellae TaxID=1675527 RepID=A0A0J9EC12_9RHOB|nr:Type I secretion system, outer membrane component LapE [Candidatus Rhodobacter lobularis]